MTIGGRLALTAAPLDSRGAPMAAQAITWASDNPAVATVDSVGGIGGAAAGTARITATTGGVVGATTVTVVRAPVGALVLHSPTPNVMAGSMLRLTATVRDSVGTVVTDRPVTWSLMNGQQFASLAAIGSGAELRAVMPGIVTVAGTAEGVVATVTIQVLARPVARVDLAGALRITLAAATTWTATPRDSAGMPITGQVVTWEVDSPAVTLTPTPNSTTATLFGQALGTAMVRATADGMTARATVAVVPAAVEVSPGTAVITAGSQLQLRATARDARTAPIPNVVAAWSSSDTTRVTVSAAGVLSARAPGAVVVTASVQDVRGTATVNIVSAPPIYVLGAEIGNGQTAPAGTLLPVAPAAVLRDAAGRPVSGIPITFSVVSGGGEVTEPATRTDTRGLAAVGSWRLGTLAAPQTLRADANIPGISGVSAQWTATLWTPPSPTNPSPACCVRCTTGKPCGNSCIAANLTCRQGPGCACYATAGPRVDPTAGLVAQNLVQPSLTAEMAAPFTGCNNAIATRIADFIAWLETL